MRYKQYVKNPTTGKLDPVINYTIQPYNDAPIKAEIDTLKANSATKSEVSAIDAKIGNINNMLDNINGEQI